jgi:hypothetical protein
VLVKGGRGGVSTAPWSEPAVPRQDVESHIGHLDHSDDGAGVLIRHANGVPRGLTPPAAGDLRAAPFALFAALGGTLKAALRGLDVGLAAHDRGVTAAR